MSRLAIEMLERLADRLTALEELFTHLQRTVQELDESVLAGQKRIDALERQLARHADDLAALAEPPPPPRDPLDERPPHY